MILILSSNTNQQSGDYQQLIAYLAGLIGVQMRVHVERGTEQVLTEIYLIGNTKQLDIKDMQSLPCVERVVRVSEEYRILGQHKDDSRPTYFDYNGVRFGQDTLNVFAGLCAVDNAEHVEIMLKALRDNGQVCTRMGAYKPRTSPYDFQGLGRAGLEILAEARAETGLPIVTEVMDPRLVEEACRYADLLQIGARSMQNFPLLREVGRCGKPVMLKRHWAATLVEWLCAAEYVASEGNLDVILCERGIRTFSQGEYNRNTLDLNVIPAVRRETFLPVIVDPSHGTGVAELVPSASGAAIGAG
ncbi:MAG: 3-deoxy-7-phosphoheptulonate synthase, partial [Betaproteobacteria bacterium]|nr:3-deoxy-7-phosphoheptulonate synthase [Betaproteobacteria bacterium]